MDNAANAKKLDPKKAQRNIILGSALLAATTNVGPGFCTQSTLFTYQYLGGMLLAILVCAVFDSTMQALSLIHI